MKTLARQGHIRVSVLWHPCFSCRPLLWLRIPNSSMAFPPKTHFLSANLQTLYKDGVSFSCDLWCWLSVKNIPDGLDHSPHFFSALSLYLLLSLCPHQLFTPLRTDWRAWVAWLLGCIQEWPCRTLKWGTWHCSTVFWGSRQNHPSAPHPPFFNLKIQATLTSNPFYIPCIPTQELGHITSLRLIVTRWQWLIKALSPA